MTPSPDFEKALAVGRPPNIVKLFPNSKALIVSGKVIDRAMIAKGKAMTIAANGRNIFVIKGALKAAQRADAALIIEIARSESTYCPTTMWNLARRVDAMCNQYGITIPVAIHGDHYGIKKPEDVAPAKMGNPVPVRRGRDLHRHRRLAHARRRQPGRQHRPLPPGARVGRI